MDGKRVALMVAVKAGVKVDPMAVAMVDWMEGVG